MKPQPKPTKKKHKPTYKCSDGSRVTQTQIESRLAKARKEKGAKIKCEAYGSGYIPEIHGVIDNDHTISVARCKAIGKTELIWDVENISHSCRQSHNEWESYRSGEFEEHLNVIERMLYVKKHDPEGFEKRKAHISNYEILKAISYDGWKKESYEL